MKITMTLSKASIAAAVKQLETYKRSLKSKTERIVEALGNKGVEYARANLEHIDTGETLESIAFTQQGNKGTVSAGGAAVWIEFGTGVLANAGNTPHPKRNEVGAVPWGEYGKGKGKGVWDFPSRYWGWIPTSGIPLNPFMYLASQSLRQELTDIAREAMK